MSISVTKIQKKKKTLFNNNISVAPHILLLSYHFAFLESLITDRGNQYDFAKFSSLFLLDLVNHLKEPRTRKGFLETLFLQFFLASKHHVLQSNQVKCTPLECIKEMII